MVDLRCDHHPVVEAKLFLIWALLTDDVFVFIISCWYLVESILASTCAVFPVPGAANQPQSMMDPPPRWTFGKVFLA